MVKGSWLKVIGYWLLTKDVNLNDNLNENSLNFKR